MANQLYPIWKAAVQTATAAGNNINVNSAPDIMITSLLTGSYTYSAAHQFYSSASSNAVADTGTPPNNVGQTITTAAVSGTTAVFSGGNVTWLSVAAGPAIASFVIYRHNSTTNANAWPLVAFFDTAGTTLPVTPNGGNITITWSGSGIFLISDRLYKEDIQQIDRAGPLPIYEYRYVWDSERCRGFMAQDVEKVLPEAVVVVDGIRRVNYTRVIEWIG